MTEALQVTIRDTLGTSHTRRLRRAGGVPAVLYGHGQDTVHLSIPSEQLAAALRHGSKFVALQGALAESALITEIQWDPLGHDVLHLDLTRVDASEKVEVTVPVELRGSAPGVKEGGHVQHILHEIELECAATSIPDKILVNVNALALGQAIHASELVLPEGARLVSSPEALVVQCVEVTPISDELAGAAEPGEPEVIGRKAGEEEEQED